MPDSVIKKVADNFEELGTEIKDEAKKAVTDVVGGIPKQILGTGDGGQQPVEPPTNQEVIEHLYGATGKPKLSKKQVTAKAQNKAVEDARRKERIRQTLKQMLEPPEQKEPTVSEILEMEERQKEKEEAERAKKQPPALVEPSTAQKKGLFGLFFPGKKKGKRQAISDLQTSVEKRMPGGGIA